jgi:hypothetical protein
MRWISEKRSIIGIYAVLKNGGYVEIISMARKRRTAHKRRRSRGKILDLPETIISKKQTRRLMAACWNIEKLAHTADIVIAGTKK